MVRGPGPGEGPWDGVSRVEWREALGWLSQALCLRLCSVRHFLAALRRLGADWTHFVPIEIDLGGEGNLLRLPFLFITVRKLNKSPKNQTYGFPHIHFWKMKT